MLKPLQEYGIGLTPLSELPSVNGNRIFLKMESRNFLGSIKARTAYALVKGLAVPKEYVIVESTSGNLGLALDYFCKEDGRPFLCLLDETVVRTKLNYLKSNGVNCEIVPTEPGLDGRLSRMKRAEELADKDTYFWVNQYNNEDGVLIHQETTGPEIFEQTKGTVTYVFCAVGSGGTICGIGEYFKSRGLSVKMVGVEPYGSTIFHSTDAPYITSGAGLCGMPGNIKRHIDVVDEAVCVCDNDSIIKCQELNASCGLDVGLTTGMAYAAAERFCKTTTDQTVVVIAADGMEFYRDYM